jgi:hypothetical protein
VRRMDYPIDGPGAAPSIMVITTSAGREPAERDVPVRSTVPPGAVSVEHEPPPIDDILDFPERRLSRMVRYRPLRSLETQLRELDERIDRETLDKIAAGLFETHGWRTALVVAEGARELTQSGDWEAANAWHRLFEVVFERMTAMDKFE